ncbi:hypothetical protein IMSHALPRED_007923 [Imshaugia aleurites]|uniref:7-dehydrocholesterol reductase n=1 Tax=Imshaugia aleurites TaxID=172621 RepID=A0A8H3FXW2_9LECA|nr:hypothetical protein IMSHALPRED_007923 [Imshaugia aleurites]
MASPSQTHTLSLTQITDKKPSGASCENVEVKSINAQLLMVAQASLKLSLLADSPFPGKITWGRSSLRRSWLRSLFSASPVWLAPLTALSFFVTLSQYDGSLSKFVAAISQEGFLPILNAYGPRFTLKGTLAYTCWIALQATLFKCLPGPINTGQRTPAGHLLAYRTNGLWAWVITHVLYVALCWFGILDPGFVPRNWGGLVAAMNLAGFLLSAFAYAKAYVMPTHPDDRNFSGTFAPLPFSRLSLITDILGSAPFDFYMGIELNPRISELFDFKLFTNGRPGLIAWTLMFVPSISPPDTMLTLACRDISNIAYQYQIHHRVAPSIVLVTILHFLYVLDFFVNEAWYLRTIDIAHDHFGFYLAWGCFTWVPTMYTLQAQYLGLYPTSPSTAYLAVVFGIGLAGYALFRSVNDQKDRVRRSGGKCSIWGKPAEYITAAYKTSDGAQHESILLCSGWWGWSRHANYVGDLLLSTAMCALVGTTEPLVWFYAVFMAVLLVHRCIRDEERGSAKYGASWEKYCRQVPWRLVPGIW